MFGIWLACLQSLQRELLLAAACKPDGGIADGLPPVEDGLSEFQIVEQCRDPGHYVQAGEVIGLQLPIPMPFEHQFWRDTALNGNGSSNDAGGPYLTFAASKPVDLPLLPLRPGPHFEPFCAQFVSTIVPQPVLCNDRFQILHQEEAILFARDPVELYDAMSNPEWVNGPFGCNWTKDTNNCREQTETDWEQQTSRGPADGSPLAWLPHVASIPYPPSPQPFHRDVIIAGKTYNAGGYPWNAGEVSENDFWLSGETPAGPGLEPTGRSSIKAVAAVQHGMCSHYLDLETDVFQPLVNEIWSQYDSTIKNSDPCNCTDVDRDFIHTISFINPVEDNTSDQNGGFFLNFAFRNTFHNGLGFTDDNVNYNVAYQWVLTNDGGTVLDMTQTYPRKRIDGRPIVKPNFVDGTTSGHDGSQLGEAFFSSLNDTLPEDLYEIADQSLEFDGPRNALLCDHGGSKDADNCYPCTPGDETGLSYPDHDPTIALSSDPSQPAPQDGGQCQNASSPFVQDLFSNIQSAAQTAGFSQADMNLKDPTSALSVIMRNVFELETSSAIASSRYKHIRCNSYFNKDKNKQISRCEYAFPAKRVVTLPDQLELVFLDQEPEVNNPAYPVYLMAKYYYDPILKGLDASSPGQGYPLCDAAPPCGNKATAMPRYVTPGSPFFNRQYAKTTMDSYSDAHTGGLLCNPVSCPVIALSVDLAGWVSAHF